MKGRTGRTGKKPHTTKEQPHGALLFHARRRETAIVQSNTAAGGRTVVRCITRDMRCLRYPKLSSTVSEISIQETDTRLTDKVLHPPSRHESDGALRSGVAPR